MSVPGAAPPPQRLAAGPEAFGPYRLSAQIAQGRRTTTFLVQPSGDAPMQVLRRVRDGMQAQLRAERPDLSFVTQGQALGFIEDLVVGESLATILNRFIGQQRALPLPVALTVAMGIATRLDAMARPHHDLLPQHVLLGYDGQVHLIDPTPEGADHSVAPGREGYRAPEHIDGAGLDRTTDVFGLGIILFEMSTGTRLFDPSQPNIDEQIAAAKVPRPRDIVGDGYPIELQLVLRKLMRPSKAGRFPSARATQDALRLVATTRADIGPGPVATWLATEFNDRKAAWAPLVGDTIHLAPKGPLDVRPRAPSRAQTRPSSFLGSGAPTIEELRLDHSTLEAVRQRIMSDGAAPSTHPDSGQQALRDEIAQMKQRRTHLPALPQAGADGTQPAFRPIGAPNEQTLQDLDVPEAQARPSPPPAATAPSAPPAAPRIKPKGLASSPPPMMVPELPTEVSARFAPLPQPMGLELEPSDSGAPTSLDELQAAPFAVAEIDMLGAGTLPPGASSTPTEQIRAPSPPQDLSELTPQALLAPTTDRSPVPDPLPSLSAEDLHPAPKLSEDLVLEPLSASSDLVEPAAQGAWAEALLDPPQAPLDAEDEAQTPLANLALDLTDGEAEDSGDTIQDQSALEFLGADDLARLQRAVEVLPAPGQTAPDDAPASPVAPPQPQLRASEGSEGEANITLQDEGPEPLAALAPPAPEQAFVGSSGGSSGEAFVAEARAPQPAPSPASAAASQPPEPRGLGVSPQPQHGAQARIATQVVRDRVLPSEGPAHQEPVEFVKAQPPLLDRGGQGMTPTPHLDLGPPRTSSSAEDEELSGSHLVIPISDAELEETERRQGTRWIWVAGPVALIALAGLTGFAVSQWQAPLTEVQSVAATEERAPRPAVPGGRAPTRAPAPTRAEPAPSEPSEGAGDAKADLPESADDFVPTEPEAAVMPNAMPEQDEAPEPRSRRPAPPPRTKRSPPAPPPAAPVSENWTLIVHALPEGASIRVDGHSIANDSVVVLSGSKPVPITISREGYQTMTATVTPQPQVERHFMLRKMR